MDKQVISIERMENGKFRITGEWFEQTCPAVEQRLWKQLQPHHVTEAAFKKAWDELSRSDSTEVEVLLPMPGAFRQAG